MYTIGVNKKVTYVAAGLRNPVRMYYHAAADDLYIGDVGFGDAGTSERIFKSNGIAGMLIFEKNLQELSTPFPRFFWYTFKVLLSFLRV
jgi:hypothetical protein